MAYTYKYNVLSGEFDIVQDTSLLTLKGTVDTTGDLPLTGNSENDCYIVKGDDRIYTWNKATPDGELSNWLDIGKVAVEDKVPVGALMPFAGESAPTGYLLCNGNAVSKITYADLFVVIGYIYGGSGDTFNLPNMIDKHPLGVGTKTLGASGGSLDHTHIGGSHTHPLANHRHTLDNHRHSFSGSVSGNTGSNSVGHTHTYNQVINHTHPAFSALAGVPKPARLPTTDVLVNTYFSGTHSYRGLCDNTNYTYAPSVSTSLSNPAGGVSSGTTGGQSANHTHSFSDSFSGNTGYYQGNSGYYQGTSGGGGTVATGSNNAPYLALNYIIRY